MNDLEKDESKNLTNNEEEVENQTASKTDIIRAKYNINVLQSPIQYYLIENGPYQKLIYANIYLFFFYLTWFWNIFHLSLGIHDSPYCLKPTTIKDACSKDCLEIGYSSYLFSNKTVAMEYQAHCRVPNYKKTLKCYELVCYAAICLFGPSLVDIFGRKRFVIGCAALNLICSIGIQFSVNLWMVIVFVAIEFMITVFCWITLIVLMVEVTSPNFLELSFSIYELSSCFGDLTFVGLSYAFGNWRKLNIYTVAFCVLLVPSIFLIPESPTWLFANDKLNEAIKTVQLLLKWNKRKTLIEDIRANIEKAWRLTRSKPKSTDSFLILFYYGCMRKILFLVCYISLTVAASLVLVNFNFSKSSHFNRLGQLSLQFAGIIAYLCLYPHCGRRQILMYGLATSGFLILINAISLEIDSEFNGIYISCLYAIVLYFTRVNFYLYFLELFPTKMRTIPISIMLFFSVLGMLLMQQTNAWFKEPTCWLPSAIASIMCFYGVAAARYLPETKGYPLSNSLREAEALALKHRQTFNYN